MTHDPLCDSIRDVPSGWSCRECDIIAKAREQAIRDCIAVVEALEFKHGNAALAALRALLEGEKP